jgi:hypothetical protein
MSHLCLIEMSDYPFKAMRWRRTTIGWVLMSGRDVRRIEVLTEILSGRRTVASATKSRSSGSWCLFDSKGQRCRHSG